MEKEIERKIMLSLGEGKDFHVPLVWYLQACRNMAIEAVKGAGLEFSDALIEAKTEEIFKHPNADQVLQIFKLAKQEGVVTYSDGGGSEFLRTFIFTDDADPGKAQILMIPYYCEADCVKEYTTADGKKFVQGGRVRVLESSDYAFLEGRILKMRMAPNDETDNEGMDIHCAFNFPEEGSPGYKTLEALLKDWSGLNSVEEIALDDVIMCEDELVPVES